MTNKYICPCCDVSSWAIWNEHKEARTIAEAKDKIMSSICEFYDWDNPYDWDDFVEFADDNDVKIGEVTDLETF